MSISNRYPARIISAARAASRLSGNDKAPFASINLVQWAVESAYGKSASGKNNFFGIKATPAQITAGKATKRLTHETVNGVYGPYDLYFADFDSEAECFAAHTALLTNPTMGWAYKDCWVAKDADSYAMALQEHYATGMPDHPYGETLIQWMRRDGLYEADGAAEPVPPKAKAPTVGGAIVVAGGAATAAHATVAHAAAGAGHLLPLIVGVGIFLIVAIGAIIATRKA